MAQPTQDTDISSSLAGFKPSQNDGSSSGLSYMEVALHGRSKINTMIRYKYRAEVHNCYEKKDAENVEIDNSKFHQDTIPWLIKYSKILCSSVGNRSFHILERLLLLYTQNILSSIEGWCIKTCNIIELKNHISQTLIFFHLYWHDVKEHVTDHNSYLNKMSVLLRIYIDMEFKTFKCTKSSSKVATKLLTALSIYLHNSEEHIFRVLLRIKFLTKKCTKICDSIFTKCFNNITAKSDAVTDVVYVRYLLALKLWKRIKESAEEKKKVNMLALVILGPRMPKMSEELLKVIPKPPLNHANETIWLLQPKVFDLKQACERFLQFEEVTHVKTCSKNSYATKAFESAYYQKSQGTTAHDIGYSKKYFSYHGLNTGSKVNVQNDNFFMNATKTAKSVDEIQPVKKECKLKRSVPISKVKPGEVILIDLTEEKESLTKENKKIKRKSKNRLEWLKFVRKKSKVQKSANPLMCLNQVEIADAHSTENSESIVPTTFVEHLPISDDKVSESTESSAVLQNSSFPIDAYCVNPKSIEDSNKRNSKCTIANKNCNLCSSSQKQDDIQYNSFLCLIKLLNIVSPNVKDSEMILNLLKELREGNLVSTLSNLINANVVNRSSSAMTQDKEEVFSQEKSSVDLICSSKECQNNTVNLQAIKQELPSSTDCNMLSNIDGYYNTSDRSNIRYINDYNKPLPGVIKQRISYNQNECCGTHELKAAPHNNNDMCNIIKSENAVQTSRDGTVVDKNSCDKSIIDVLSDLDKCMYVLNRIGEHVMVVRAEKQRVEYSEKKPDICAVSTTVAGDQTASSSLGYLLKDVDSSMSDKICRLLKLYENKQHLCACNLKELCEKNLNETAVISEEVQYNVRNCTQEIVVSTSKSDKSHLDNSFLNQSSLIEDKPQCSILEYNKLESKEQCDHKSGRKTPMMEQSHIKNECRTSVPNNQIRPTQTCMMDMLLSNNDDIPSSKITSGLRLKGFSHTEEEDTMKTDSMNEFEDIDILDSILNGDLTMQEEQDILGDSQSVLMSQIDCNTSSSTLNNITDFFTQSEDSLDDKKEDMLYTASSLGDLSKPLPEGSLGTTGILNSLLDFDLTSMGSPPNDFMYSHVQTVDPCLIKKSVDKEIFSTSISEDVPELLFEKQSLSPQIDIMVDNPHRDSNLVHNQNPMIESSVDMVGMDINTNEQGVLHFSLPKLADSPGTQGNMTSLLSDSNELREFKHSATPSDKIVINDVAGPAYIKPDADTTKQLQTGETNAVYRSPNKVCVFKKITANNLMKPINESEDPPSSTYSCVSTCPIQFDVNSVPLELLDTSHLKSSKNSLLYNINVIPKSDISQCKRLKACVALESPESKHFYEKSEMRPNDGHNFMLEHEVEINAQSESPGRELQDEKRDEGEYQKQQAKSIQGNQGTVVWKRPATTINPLTPVSTSYQRTMCSSKKTYMQLKDTKLQSMDKASEQNRSLLRNSRANCNSDVSYKEDVECKDIEYSVKDDPLNDLNIQCKLNSMGKKLHVQHKVDLKFTRTAVKVEREAPKMNLTRHANLIEVSDKRLVKQTGKSLTRRTDVQSRKSAEDTTVMINEASLEETPMKKRRTSASSLEADEVVYSPDHQEVRKTRFIPMKSDYICTSRRRNAVGK